MGWLDGRLLSFDTETTGVDPETDRIVTAACVAAGGGEPVQATGWLLDPVIEISEGATAVHGITTAHATVNGLDPWEGVAEIADAVRQAVAAGTPLVIYNARFDLTLLDRECRRYGVEVPDWERARVVDPLVIDKWLHRFRRGSRKLVDVCAHYGVEFSAGDAHGAEADALASARLAWVLGARANFMAREQSAVVTGRSVWKNVRGDLDALHAAQVSWARDQAVGLRSYFEGRGEAEKAASVHEEWPLVPFREVVT